MTARIAIERSGRDDQDLPLDLPGVMDWEGWSHIDGAERRAGAIRGRERTKLVDHVAMRAHAAPTPIPLEESTR